ncbi:hypothetical protein AD936_02125, partial [Gluconobacter japonicus]
MDDPTVGLMAVIPVPMAQKLVRLRELRAAQARKTALLRTQEAHAGWEDVKRSQTVLDSHREHWRAVEAEGTARMNGTVSPQALRDRHDHLGALADRAIALQKDVGLRADTARKQDEAAALAWRAHREFDQRCGHAARLLDGARNAERREQEALDEQELEDLALMRHAARDFEG